MNIYYLYCNTQTYKYLLSAVYNHMNIHYLVYTVEAIMCNWILIVFLSLLRLFSKFDEF